MCILALSKCADIFSPCKSCMKLPVKSQDPLYVTRGIIIEGQLDLPILQNGSESKQSSIPVTTTCQDGVAICILEMS